jgi:hypothetical protein
MFLPSKELIEKHRANWPATRSNNTLSTYELWADPSLVKMPFLSVCLLCSVPPLYIGIPTYILHRFTFHERKHQKKEKKKGPWFSTKMVGGDGMIVWNSSSSSTSPRHFLPPLFHRLSPCGTTTNTTACKAPLSGHPFLVSYSYLSCVVIGLTSLLTPWP